jgi:DNA polymerase delta subunit 1
MADDSTKKRKMGSGEEAPANKAPSPGKDSPLPAGNKRMKPSPPQEIGAASSSATSAVVASPTPSSSSSSSSGGGETKSSTAAGGASSGDVGWRRPQRPHLRPSHDTLAFQIVDIDMCDGRPLKENPAKDPITGIPKQRPGMTNPSATVPILRIFGVTDAGNSCVAHVHGFTPYFICDAPPNYNPNAPAHSEMFRAALDQAVREQTRGNNNKGAHFVLDVDTLHKRSLVGFTPGAETSHFLKISVAMPKNVPTARRVLERGFSFNGRRHEYLTYESNIPFVLRFMVDKDITGCCWVQLPAGTYSLRGDGLGPPGASGGGGATNIRKASRMQIEADIYHNELVAHESVGRWMGIAPIRILSFDIECQGRKGHFPEAEKDPVIQIASIVSVQGESSPRLKTIHVLGTCTDIVGATVHSYDDERELLKAWAKFLVQTDFDVITGYNIQNFDLPYVFNRAKALGVHSQVTDISRVMGRRATMREATFSSSAFGTRKDWETTICGRLVFDMIKYMRRNHKFSSYTLNAVSAHFLGQQKEDVHYSIISDLQNGTADDRRRLAVYCIKDALLPQRLMDKLYVLINYIEMARVTGVPLDYLNSRGQQIKVMSMLLRKCRLKGDLVIPTPKRSQGDASSGVAFEGATVIEPIKGFYKEPIATLDFASLYPSIMQAHNLCYSTLLTHQQANAMPESQYTKTPNGHYFVNQTVRQGILPEILGELLSARKRAKKDMKAAKDKLTKNVMNGRQLALKISANSVYGFTGATVGQLPCLQISSSVTAFGREMIDATKENVESTYTVANGYPADAVVIYGDTDSVMIKFGVPDVATSIAMGEKAAPEITAALFKAPIKLEFEKVYKPYLLMNKKRYAGLYWTRPEKFDKLDTKGIETVRRDNCGLVRTVIAHCLNRLLIHEDTDGAKAFVKRRIADLLQNKIDISMLVISKSMSKRWDQDDYKAKQAHVELARRLHNRDPATAPQIGDRVPYVITKGRPGAPAFEKSEDPLYALENNVPLDTAYYLHNQLSKPLLRIFTPIIGDSAESELLRGAHTRHIVKATPTSKKGGMMAFAVKKKTRCIGCKSLVDIDANGNEQALCRHCKSNEGLIYAKRQMNARKAEAQFNKLWSQCQRCQGSLHNDVLCSNRDCPIFYARVKARKDVTSTTEALARFSLKW